MVPCRHCDGPHWDPTCPKKPKLVAGSKPKEKGATNVAAAHSVQANALVAGNSLAASSAHSSALDMMLGNIDDGASDDGDPDYDPMVTTTRGLTPSWVPLPSPSPSTPTPTPTTRV